MVELILVSEICKPLIIIPDPDNYIHLCDVYNPNAIGNETVLINGDNSARCVF